MMIELIERLRAARLSEEPYRWALVQGLFSERDREELSAHFPTQGFTRTRRDQGTDKRYEMAARPLHRSGGAGSPREDLAPVWRRLLDELCSPAYRQALSALTGVGLEGHLMEIGCFRYGPGCYISAHPDKPQKSVGHVLYFNRTWKPEWGGAFRVLGSDDESAVAAEIWPYAGDSVVLVRSDDSWHCVTPVTGPAERMAVHVDFWRTDPGEAPGRQVYGPRST